TRCEFTSDWPSSLRILPTMSQAVGGIPHRTATANPDRPRTGRYTNVSLQRLGEVFRTSAELSDAVSRAVRDGQARKLHGRLYTTNMVEEPEAIVRRNLWQVVSLLFPGTVLSHRTALEMRPTPGGTVFLTGRSNRVVGLPGLRV